VVAELLPALIGNMAYLYTTGKRCISRDEMHTADGGRHHPTLPCVFVFGWGAFKRLEVARMLRWGHAFL
jgi:hypothetical protein